MFDIVFHSIGNYKHPEKGDYYTPCCQVGFITAGFKYLKIGNDLLDVDVSCPLLIISPPGTRFVFEATEKRNNWAILFDSTQIRASGNTPQIIEICYHDQWLALPMFLPIIVEHVSGWEGEFIRMYNAFRSPTPINKLRCELGIYNIFRYFIDKKPDSFFASPADKLKWLIDQDIQAKYSLEELSSQCGFSSDHLRILFQNHYGMLPQFYRNKMRMAYAMSLISNSHLTIKEISEKVGFKYVSHFTRMFKNTFGLTPRQGVRKFRDFSGH